MLSINPIRPYNRIKFTPQTTDSSKQLEESEGATTITPAEGGKKVGQRVTKITKKTKVTTKITKARLDSDQEDESEEEEEKVSITELTEEDESLRQDIPKRPKPSKPISISSVCSSYFISVFLQIKTLYHVLVCC